MGLLCRRHAVFVPYPTQGHINPCMQLAKLLHSRGFYITFVNTQFNHRRLIRAKGPDFIKGLVDFRFETIPDGLPPLDSDATQDIWALSDSVRKNCLAPFRQLLAKLNASPELPPVTCIISDGNMTFTIEAAKELGIREVQFYTTSACGFMAYLHFGELIKRGIIPFKDENFFSDGTLETTINCIPGMSNIQLKDFPSFIRTTDHNDIMLNFMKDETENCFKSSAIILNTFDELEHEVLEAITTKIPHVYTIGPLSLFDNHMPSEGKLRRSSLWKEDDKCLEWLNQRERNSVVFVSFGSITVISSEHFEEFAWGLANGEYPFLWVVRPDLVMENSAVLPQEFYEKTKNKGLLVSWCPQEQVLSHPSIGVFITHSGWNSTLESICGGVPVICWPFFDEQPTNSLYSCNVWGIGMCLDHDVKRHDITAAVQEIMEGDKGRQIKKNASEWKKKAQKAASIGGSSYRNLGKLMKEVLFDSK